MFKYRIQFLLYVSVLIISLQSCITQGLIVSDNEEEISVNSYFNSENEKYIFRTGFEIYDQYFSGLLVIKQIQKDTFRIIFLNELGMKFFDFELSERKFKIHHIFEPMNRKMLLKLLENDFRLLLLQQIQKNKIIYCESRNEKFSVIINKKDRTRFFIENTTKNISEIQKYSKFRKISTINFTGFRNKFPDNIKIKHENIKFAIRMKLIK